MEKFKEIQNRLNNMNVQESADGPNKIKIKQLQTMIGRLTGNLEQDDITREYKLNQMLQKVRKIQGTLKDCDQQTSIKDAALDSTVNRVQKSIKKKLQKLLKMKRQADKDFQASLNNYLIELAGFKSKMNHSCLASIGILKQKQAQIEQLHRNQAQNTALTKQILKKIYQQYSGQIQELNRLILQQQKQRKCEEQILLQRLQNMYEKMNKEIKEIKKNREKSEGQMIGLLQKVVDRVRSEVVRM